MKKLATWTAMLLGAGLLVGGGSVEANPVLDAVLSPPRGVPKDAHASLDIKDGVVWRKCFGSRVGSVNAVWFAKVGLMYLGLQPGVACGDRPDATSPAGLWLNGGDSDVSSADMTKVAPDRHALLSDRGARMCSELAAAGLSSEFRALAELGLQSDFGPAANRHFDKVIRSFDDHSYQFRPKHLGSSGNRVFCGLEL